MDSVRIHITTEELVQDCLQIDETSVLILLARNAKIAETPRSPQPAHVDHYQYDDYTVIIESIHLVSPQHTILSIAIDGEI
jgi:hypothetical protein